MEYRARITVSNLSFTDSVASERFHRQLQTDRPDLGSVFTWSDDRKNTVVILATAANDEAEAAAILTAAVSTGLHESGLGHLYPTAVEVEVVEGDLASV